MAVIEKGFKVRIEGPENELIISDMPATVGGEKWAPTPCWFMQTALATCNATHIVIKAAQEHRA